MSDRTRETRIRRKANRQGLQLVKSRLRDPDALGYGRYMLVDADTNLALQYDGMVGPTGQPNWTLDEIEKWLTS